MGRTLPPAPVGTIPFLLIEGTCCHRCRCSFRDAGLVLLRELCFHALPRFLVPRRARFREEAACCHSHPPRWRHADDGLLNISASVSSRAWLICLVDVRRIYSINHGSRRVRSPRSADKKFSRCFFRPCCECSRAGRMYHNLIDLRSDCGVSDCVDWRCFPKA